MASKHGAEDALVALPKRAKNEIVQHAGSRTSQAIVAQGPPRTSSLQAPIMQLSGHQGDVYSAKFNPAGSIIASASFDRQICE